MTTKNPAPDGITCPDWEPKYEGKKNCSYYSEGGGCALAKNFVCVEWLKKKPAYESPPAVLQSLEVAKREIAIGPSSALPPLDVLAPPPLPDTAPKDGEPFRLAIAPGPAPRPGRLAMHPDAVHFEVAVPTTSTDLDLEKLFADPRTTSTTNSTGTTGTSTTGTSSTTSEPAPKAPTDGGAYRPPLLAVDEVELARLEELAKEITIASDAGEVVLVREHTPERFDRTEFTFREAALLRLVVDTFPGARVTKVTGAKRPVAIGDGIRIVGNTEMKDGQFAFVTKQPVALDTKLKIESTAEGMTVTTTARVYDDAVMPISNTPAKGWDD